MTLRPFQRKVKTCDCCETRRATVIRSFRAVLGAFFVCDECDAQGIAPRWAVRKRVTV